METSVENFIAASGGFRRCVDAVMMLSRAFWKLCCEDVPAVKRDIFDRNLGRDDLAGAFAKVAKESPFQPVLDRLLEVNLGRLQSDGRLNISIAVANPLALTRAMLRNARQDHEIRYIVSQDIRHYYNFTQSSSAARQMHALADAVNTVLEVSKTQRGDAKTIVILKVDEIVPTLRQALARGSGYTTETLELFLEICRVVEYMRVGSAPRSVEVLASRIDAEYLLCHLFGLPTRVNGLDDLFGGGGIMLGEAANGSGNVGIGGRAVVTVGPFGSAKSVLSLQMAVEVASKGGIAWVMPLEQSAEECKYILESMGSLRESNHFSQATTVSEAVELLEHREPGKGALILLRSVQDHFDDFLATFEENVRWMKDYPLQLIVVDPISAVPSEGSVEDEKRRGKLLQSFETIKRGGTNIWLVVEEGIANDKSPYEQKIADTVIRLSTESRHGYSQRYIEISKSRMQRELRGRHAFTIGPGKGITIYPSSAAVRSRLRQRSERPPNLKIEFGLPSLDRILGKSGLYDRDVIVLHGAGGSYKTQIGLSFLLGTNQNSGRPLLLSARDSEASIRHSLQRVMKMDRGVDTAPAWDPGELRVLTLGAGYVKAGYILQRLEDELRTALQNGRRIGRVMVDNLAHWDFSCPYLREDETFGDTLVAMLRVHSVTSLLICSESNAPNAVLQRSVVDNADCLVQFGRIPIHGTPQVILRVLKTRDMGHRRESFPLVVTPRKIEVKAEASLVRFSMDGAANAIKVRLFLHGESEAQTTYNEGIAAAIRSTLSPEVNLESELPLQISRLLSIGRSSSIDELQILQLDELHMPVADQSIVQDLQVFPSRVWSVHYWSDVIPRLRMAAKVKGGFCAAPYYTNVSLLAFRKTVPPDCVGSWEDLSLECLRWEAEHKESEKLFFTFPMGSSENYNALFLEILLWLSGPPQVREKGAKSGCALRDWLTSDASISATRIFFRLCRRAHAIRHHFGANDPKKPISLQVDSKAQVWRHWYSTLNLMLAGMEPADRADITVSTLPGKASLAGEWFLVVPRYSAASDVGQRLIELYTSREAEIERLEKGVGLPVRETFYKEQENTLSGVSPYFAMDRSILLEIIQKAFCRSSFGCYRSYASVLSAHLQSILLLPCDQGEVEKNLRERKDTLKRNLQSIDAAQCDPCNLSPYDSHGRRREHPGAATSDFVNIDPEGN